MNQYAVTFACVVACSFSTFAQDVTPDQMERLARKRAGDLRLSTYITAGAVRRLAGEEAGRVESLPVLRGMGISKIVIEVYRSGIELTHEELVRVRDFFENNGYEVTAGIATVPGGDFGVQADRGYTWFNWQNEKTQRDLRRVVRRTAAVFDTFVLDDFLCSADQSAESDAARGGRSWGEYRRDLLTELCQTVFIGPAREVNPDITMIIKYPQWYDRFHLFGYDVFRKSPQFDEVWVGTETRGARTQRFGFVQPYEGYVNYRWIDDVSGGRVTAAWFDHGDCDAHDFLDQAWMTVLAGARDIVFFNFSNLVQGHPGHQLFRNDFVHLADLAAALRDRPAAGIPAYKPPNSEAGGDQYVMDYIGMLGVSLEPVSRFPEDAQYVFLPTQAAAAPEAPAKLKELLGRTAASAVVTAGFLATAQDSELFELAGVAPFTLEEPLEATQIFAGSEPSPIEPPLTLAARLRPAGATVQLSAVVDPYPVPVLLHREFAPGKSLYVVNIRTFSQADFDAVGELLLAPKALGWVNLPSSWTTKLRWAFPGSTRTFEAYAPAGVSYAAFGEGWLVQNNRSEDLQILWRKQAINSNLSNRFTEAFTGAYYEIQGGAGEVPVDVPARGRVWIKRLGGS